MKQLVIYLVSFLMLSGCTFNNREVENIDDSESNPYTLVWSDEFEYEGLPDAEKWGYDTEGNSAGWGNNEAQFYTEAREKNAIVEDGYLKIIAHKEDFEGKSYTSARLISKVDWKYGRIETNARIPGGTGTWSAIWMMPGGWSFKDGNWPDVGEIDIMEHVGHETGVVHASAHSRDYQWQKGTQKTAIMMVPDITTAFHSYTLDWTPDVVKAYVDDSLYFEYRNEGLGKSKWPYDKPFYLILNIAIGGAWGSMQGIDDDAFPQVMEVDYVRVYQRSEE